MNVLIGPVVLGVREWFLVIVVVLKIVSDTWRSWLDDKVVPDGSILKTKTVLNINIDFFTISRTCVMGPCIDL